VSCGTFLVEAGVGGDLAAGDVGEGRHGEVDGIGSAGGRLTDSAATSAWNGCMPGKAGPA
jgi:hypothetical protein